MIVLLRPILVNVTAIVTQQAAQAPNGMARGSNTGVNGGPAAQKSPDMAGQFPHAEEPEPSPEEIDAARTREITSKAMTGILLLLLKWLRTSRKSYPERDFVLLLTATQMCSSLSILRSFCWTRTMYRLC